MVIRQRKRFDDECVSKMSVSDFFQNLISNTERTSLHFNNTKVFIVPCKSCSKSPKSVQRTFIILCSHVKEKSVKADPVLPVFIEPATSYVGKQEQEEESFEVTSSKKPLSRIEHDGLDIKKSNISKTQHCQTGHVNHTVKGRKNEKQIPFTKGNKISSNSIRLEDLQIQFGKRRNEAAKSLRVSVSTLKRIARKHGIVSWPFSKISKNTGATHSLYTQTCSNTETLIQKFPESKDLATCRLDTSKSVKVKFGNNFVKFEIYITSKMGDLEEELRKRLKVEMGSFTIKYLDEDGDLILLTCDADLSYCIRSSGKIAIRMVGGGVVNVLWRPKDVNSKYRPCALRKYKGCISAHSETSRFTWLIKFKGVFCKSPGIELQRSGESVYRKVYAYLNSLPSAEDSTFANLFSGKKSSDVVLCLNNDQIVTIRSSDRESHGGIVKGLLF